MTVDDSLKRYVPVTIVASAVAGLVWGAVSPMTVPANLIKPWWLLLPWVLVVGVIIKRRAREESPHWLEFAIWYIAIANLFAVAITSLIAHGTDPDAAAGAHLELSFVVAALLGGLLIQIKCY